MRTAAVLPVKRFAVAKRRLRAAVADELHLDADTEGVVVTELGDDTTAANIGFQKGDIIVSVNNQKIAKTSDL